MRRAIDRFVDLSDLRRHLGPFYSATGRPSIDPELMIRMLLVGYCLGIRSERRWARDRYRSSVEEIHGNSFYTRLKGVLGGSNNFPAAGRRNGHKALNLVGIGVLTRP